MALDPSNSSNLEQLALKEYNHPQMRRANAFGRVSLSVCTVWALTSESLQLETLFLARKYISRMSRSSSYVKVIGSRPRSQEHKVIYSYSRVVGLR